MERPGGFGNTGKHVFWETVVSDQRPKLRLQVIDIGIEGLMDTGDNATIISHKKLLILEFRMATSKGLYPDSQDWKYLR